VNRTRFSIAAVVFTLAALPLPASTRQDPQHQHGDPAAPAPSGRSALTDAQIQQLLRGEGMGQAKAAEMTGFPGPKHVLELADGLELTPAQRGSIERVFDRMSADARQLGAQVIEAEEALYRAFESRTVTAGEIDRLTARIGQLQAHLRARHLEAHLEATPLLTPGQRLEYQRLRAPAR
jgi:Spy/CpxP family protein refolding chaperone